MYPEHTARRGRPCKRKKKTLTESGGGVKENRGDRKKHRKYSNKINQMYILSTIFNAMQKCIYRNMTLPLSSESE